MDLSNLERQLSHITAQLETLRQPSGVEDAIAALRADLSDIAHALNEAVPRRALEGLQADIHALAERIERSHGRGDAPALQGIEHRLNEVYAALNAMTPAEGLGGLDQRVSELARKVDSVATGSSDPEMLRYLEAAINELRELSHGVASAEGVAALAGDVQALGARIDHIAATTGASGLDSLAQRVHELTHALDTRVETDRPDAAKSGRAGRVADRKARRRGCAPDAIRPPSSSSSAASWALPIGSRHGPAVRRSRRDRARHPATDPAGARRRARNAIATAERVARAVAADMPRGDASDAVRQRSRNAARPSGRERPAHAGYARSRA